MGGLWGGWDRLDPRGEGDGLRVSQAKGRVLPQHGQVRLGLRLPEPS